MAALTGRLQQWDGRQPDLRAWSDAELLDGLRQLGIATDQRLFTALVADKSQTDQEEDWLQESAVTDENLQVFVWLSVRELWQRWQLPSWPLDRLGRMLAYLIDAEFAAEYADQLHAPTANEVFAALEAWLAKQPDARAAVDGLVEQLGMPPQAWPGKLLDAMAEWTEVGHVSLALRGGGFLTRVLGHGDAHIFLAAALVSARMLDRAVAAALEVPMRICATALTSSAAPCVLPRAIPFWPSFGWRARSKTTARARTSALSPQRRCTTIWRRGAPRVAMKSRRCQTRRRLQRVRRPPKVPTTRGWLVPVRALVRVAPRPDAAVPP